MTFYVEVATRSSLQNLYSGSSDARAKETLQNAISVVTVSRGTCIVRYKNADTYGEYHFENGVDANLAVEMVADMWDGKNPAQRAAWLSTARVVDNSMLYVWITKRFNELPRKMREALIASKSEAGVL